MDYETDPVKMKQIGNAVNQAIADDPARFIERSFTVLENTGHSIRLIRRDDPRQAISIPWADLSSLREMIDLIIPPERKGQD